MPTTFCATMSYDSSTICIVHSKKKKKKPKPIPRPPPKSNPTHLLETKSHSKIRVSLPKTTRTPKKRNGRRRRTVRNGIRIPRLAVVPPQVVQDTKHPPLSNIVRRPRKPSRIHLRMIDSVTRNQPTLTTTKPPDQRHQVPKPTRVVPKRLELARMGNPV